MGRGLILPIRDKPGESENVQHRKQRKARHAALTQRHSLGTLTLIESYTAKVKKTLDAWNLRIKLAGTPAHRIPTVAATSPGR